MPGAGKALRNLAADIGEGVSTSGCGWELPSKVLFEQNQCATFLLDTAHCEKHITEYQSSSPSRNINISHIATLRKSPFECHLL